MSWLGSLDLEIKIEHEAKAGRQKIHAVICLSQMLLRGGTTESVRR